MATLPGLGTWVGTCQPTQGVVYMPCCYMQRHTVRTVDLRPAPRRTWRGVQRAYLISGYLILGNKRAWVGPCSAPRHLSRSPSQSFGILCRCL